MDYIKYIIIFFWLGPIFFLNAAIFRYINRNVSTPYIIDIVAAICFCIGLITQLICENLNLKGPTILENIMYSVYSIAPICYLLASIFRVLQMDPLLNNIIDLLATICFFTGTNIRLFLEIRKKNISHIAVVSIYWVAHLFFICAFITYTVNINNKLGNYFEIISACFFVIAASIWLLGEILMRNCKLFHNLDPE